MKKYLIFILAIAAVSLTSCLKDKPNTDFSNTVNQTVVEMPFAGLQYFSRDAITDAGDTIVKKFGINIASAKTLSTDTKYTIAVDYSLLTSYVAANSAIAYEQMPAGSYTIDKTSGTIKAGQRLDSITVTFYKSKLDPAKSYMLPIKLASASNGILSGNFNAHYYHFIGNDFAGTYHHYYTRWSVPDTTGSLATADAGGPQDKGPSIFNPVSPTEFVVPTYYYTGPNYDVTFVKTGSGATATYSNFSIQFLPADVASGTQWASAITVAQAPIFLPADYHTNPFDPNKQYTYTQALSLFRFYFVTASRAIIDTYVKE
ncbi:MAG TPA: DUF1735 domain-containing protein [Mucilaginibacter sp.]|jgi:hypothetical protein|nr:DUF1735 domain-containing protein [Mucilaginibacter sp.]